MGNNHTTRESALLPYFTEFCTSRIPVPTPQNLWTFVCSSGRDFTIVNLCRPLYSTRQDDHFHTRHVIPISSSQRCASGNSWHRGAQSRSFLWSALMLWQSDCRGHGSPLAKSSNTEWYVATALVLSTRYGTLRLLLLSPKLYACALTQIHTIKLSSLQTKTTKKQRLLHIGLLTVWIDVVWGSYPGIAFAEPAILMVI